MKRLMFAFALILGAARAAESQQVGFVLPVDSVLALRPGTSGYVDLQVQPGTYPYTSYFYSNYYYSYPYSCYYTYSYPPYYCSYTSYAQYGLSAYSVTLHFDDAQAEVLSAAGAGYGFADPTVTPATGAVTLEATGAYDSSPLTVARVRLGLTTSATAGSLVTIQVNHLTSSNNSSPDNLLAGAYTTTLRICHATKVWGDLDGNGAATTRDALIELSAAVGLPVDGFDLTVSDVDDDRATTSRDALLILSAGIGLETYTRTGHGIADVCPTPPSAPPAYLSPRVATRESLR